MIINRTAHPLNFYRREDTELVDRGGRTSIAPKEGAVPVLVVPSMGVFNVSKELTAAGETAEGVLVYTAEFKPSGEPLPAYKEGVYIVVSAMAYTVWKEDRPDLHTVIDPVWKDGKVVGCIGIGRS